MDSDDASNRKSKNKVEEFEEPLEQPGKIIFAQIHGSAQRLLKVKKLSKYIRFCRCCYLPSETPGLVMPYTCLDNLKDFGLGIHLYFIFILFCLLISFINFCMSSIPTMVFTIRYSNHLKKHCKIYYYPSNSTIDNNTIKMNLEGSDIFYPELLMTGNKSDCLKYISQQDSSKINDNSKSIIETDWIIEMSVDTIGNYFSIYKIKSNKGERLVSNFINFPFIYFLTSLTTLIVNFFFIHYVNLLNDKEDFEETSPKDFTILIHGVKKNYDKEKPDPNITRTQSLKNLLNEISDNYFKLDIYDIIPCYNLTKLYALTKKIFDDRIKIYHAKNFKRQKDLHNDYISGKKITLFNFGSKKKDKEKDKDSEEQSQNTNSSINNSINLKPNLEQKSPLAEEKKGPNESQTSESGSSQDNDQNLNYYNKYLCIIKPTPIMDIEQRITQNKLKISEIEKDLNENPEKYSCGTFFVVFKYISMRDKIYQFFPTSFPAKVFMKIKYFLQNVVCSRFTSEQTKRLNFLKNAFTIEHATEAYEVMWQNLGYTNKQKYLYLSFSAFTTIILIGLSFVIVLGLNYAQDRIENNKTTASFLRYFISLLISISISIINSLGRTILKVITSKFEAIETRTDYYISLSIKLSIFTFINTALVPLMSNYLIWGNNDILLNNLFMIFIVNIMLAPLQFYFSVPLGIKVYRRVKAQMDLDGVPLADSTYTQGELNKIFQNPSMELSFKYSYLVNSLLTPSFYMSIFPLGPLFSVVGLIICYFFEIFYLGFYARPEVLNARLCKFFVQNFKIIISVFSIGNYIFLSKSSDYYKANWSLVNLIIFNILAFVPYYSFKINFVGLTEGEAVKGSYEEYSLMFPTDYEKENPLTKKNAMIKHFKKLKEMNLILQSQCDTLIKNIRNESTMENYYKTSRNVGKVLNSYEFQRQFVKLKKKYRFIKEVRRKQSILNKVNSEDEIRRRNASVYSRQSNIFNRSGGRFRSKDYSGFSFHNIMKDKDNESNLGYNKTYNCDILITDDRRRQRRTSQYMRRALFQRIKDEGIYSESEEESEDESINSESLDSTSNKNNKDNESSNSGELIKKRERNNRKNSSNTGEMNTIIEETKNEDICSVNKSNS